MRSLRCLNKSQRVALELVGAMYEAALPTAQAVTSEVGRADCEATASQRLRGHTHAREASVSAQSVEEQDETLVNPALSLR